jgi:4-hydroxybenzoate polyprenyltransferase
MSRRPNIDARRAARPLRLWLRQRLRLLLQYLAVLAEQNARYARLMRLDRPIGTWLLLWPTLWALWIAGAGRPDGQVFLIFVIGTVVMRAAGCIINDFADRNIDPHVARTAGRPLASGEVTSPEALILFAGLMLIALGLALALNRLALELAAAGAVVTVVYPFTKRFLSVPQFVLGIAFSWGVPMAFAAQLGSVPRIGWLLFVATLIWVVLYDTEYAMVDREYDLKIGVRSTAILFADMDRAMIGALQLLFFLGLALVGRGAGMGRWYYGSLLVAAIFAAYQQYLIRDREPPACLQAFLNNAWLGACIFAGIVLDYTFSM